MQIIKGVITYIIKHQKVLLIYKKRGHGAGKWNGPGGKIEKDEKISDASVRETFEETGITIANPSLCGFIRFYDVYEEDWNVYVFRTSNFEGIESETEEALPKWFNITEIPYDQMWEDDKFWLPIVLSGGFFRAEFHFQGERISKKYIVELTEEEFHKEVKVN